MKKVTVRLAVSLLALFTMVQSVSAANLLIPVGQVVGLEIGENCVTIDGFDSRLGQAAQTAGLREGDRIVAIDDIPIHSSQDVKHALQHSDGEIDMVIDRKHTTKEIELEYLEKLEDLLKCSDIIYTNSYKDCFDNDITFIEIKKK